MEAPLDVAPEQDRQTLARRATGMRFEPPPEWVDQEVRSTAGLESASGLTPASWRPSGGGPEQQVTDRQTLARRATGMRFEPPPYEPRPTSLPLTLMER